MTTEVSTPIRIWMPPVLFIGLGTITTISAHYVIHGSIGISQVALTLFLWINLLVCLWEFCLLAKAHHIEEEHRLLLATYQGRAQEGVAAAFTAPIRAAQLLSPTQWSKVWTAYSLYDRGYGDRRSFGFIADVGNGFSTLAPTLIFLVGMSWHVMPARVLGMIGIAFFYQMLYGTIVYFFNFYFNEQHLGHSRSSLALIVWFSNGIWIIFPLWGLVISVTMIQSGTYLALM